MDMKERLSQFSLMVDPSYLKPKVARKDNYKQGRLEENASQ
jgi:hypothetical protein